MSEPGDGTPASCGGLWGAGSSQGCPGRVSPVNTGASAHPQVSVKKRLDAEYGPVTGMSVELRVRDPRASSCPVPPDSHLSIGNLLVSEALLSVTQKSRPCVFVCTPGWGWGVL